MSFDRDSTRLLGWKEILDKYSDKTAMSVFDFELNCRYAGYREGLVVRSFANESEGGVQYLDENYDTHYQEIVRKCAEHYRRTRSNICINLIVVSAPSRTLSHLKEKAFIREWPNRCLEPVIFIDLYDEIHRGTAGDISGHPEETAPKE